MDRKCLVGGCGVIVNGYHRDMDDGNTTMTCICGTTHHFAPGVGVGTCAGCGLGLLLTEEVTVLDTEAAQARVREIAEAAAEGDDEAAHSRQDRLFVDALRAIALGAPDAVSLARTALASIEIPFHHHCA